MMTFEPEPSNQNYCLMARSVKVTSVDSKPSYKTLAKIATEQQKAMEHIQKLLDRSDDLLGAEMTRSESLIEDIKNLHVKYQELEDRLDTLSTTHEKLSYDYLQRKQELEKLRVAHEDLQKENDSLRTEQISPAQEDLTHHVLNALSVIMLLLLLNVPLLLLLQYLQLLMW